MLCVEDYTTRYNGRRHSTALRPSLDGRTPTRKPSRIGRPHGVGRPSRPCPRDPLEHKRLPEGGRSCDHRPFGRWPGRVREGVAAFLEKEKVAFDIGAYRDAPAACGLVRHDHRGRRRQGADPLARLRLRCGGASSPRQLEPGLVTPAKAGVQGHRLRPWTGCPLSRA